jgi:hypothetical protein
MVTPRHVIECHLINEYSKRVRSCVEHCPSVSTVRWYVAVLGEAGSGTGKTSFAFSAAVDAPASAAATAAAADDDGDWITRSKWLLFGMSCAMVLTVIVLTVVFIYRRNRRVMPPSSALALTSDSLAKDLDLEMAGSLRTLHPPRASPMVGRCRLTLSNPRRKRLDLSA